MTAEQPEELREVIGSRWSRFRAATTRSISQRR